ncbi:MAG: hypothetical protein JWN45_3025 [Acidobacteriaceae bacterium]|nr:hypothetical protein [Acidobacteriaceae bacterium]
MHEGHAAVGLVVRTDDRRKEYTNYYWSSKKPTSFFDGLFAFGTATFYFEVSLSRKNRKAPGGARPMHEVTRLWGFWSERLTAEKNTPICIGARPNFWWFFFAFDRGYPAALAELGRGTLRFWDGPPACGKTDAAVAASNECDFSVKLAHCISPFSHQLLVRP